MQGPEAGSHALTHTRGTFGGLSYLCNWHEHPIYSAVAVIMHANGEALC
jgi:hypothetical protein